MGSFPRVCKPTGYSQEGRSSTPSFLQNTLTQPCGFRDMMACQGCPVEVGAGDVEVQPQSPFLTHLLLPSPEVSHLAERGEFQGSRWPAGLGLEKPPAQMATPAPLVATGEVWLRLLLPGGMLFSLLFFFSSLASPDFPKPPHPAYNLVLTSAPISARTP